MSKPYYKEEIDGGYAFTYMTSNHSVYRAEFTYGSELFPTICTHCDDVFELSIRTLYKAPNSNDSFDVLDEIINEFCLERDAAVIYRCSNLEDRAECRHRLFNQWYNASELTEDYESQNYTNTNVINPVFCKLIVPTWHENLVGIFNEFVEQINIWETTVTDNIPNFDSSGRTIS